MVRKEVNKMTAYEAELEIASEELRKGIITIKEYNKRINDIEKESKED